MVAREPSWPGESPRETPPSPQQAVAAAAPTGDVSLLTGIVAFTNGTVSLTNGTAALTNDTVALTNGTVTLTNNTPILTNGVATNTEYRIHPADVLALMVYQEADLSADFKVTADGAINHPLLGKVPLQGLTLEEAEKTLRNLLGEKYLVNPRVTLQIRSSAARQVIVLGEVKKPGVYEMPMGKRFTMLEAIAMAGGFSEMAAVDRVSIVRTKEGQEQTIQVRVSDLLKGRREAKDVELEANDVISVPQIRF
jgi:protein involved in polysaccharide export with SLBB domain